VSTFHYDWHDSPRLDALLQELGASLCRDCFAVTPAVVESDMGHDGEATRHLRVVSSHLVEEHVGDVVPDDRPRDDGIVCW
jgi:hypothetical protein